jgi:hypothetical protein
MKPQKLVEAITVAREAVAEKNRRRSELRTPKSSQLLPR